MNEQRHASSNEACDNGPRRHAAGQARLEAGALSAAVWIKKTIE
jgi:hypothetical protein